MKKKIFSHTSLLIILSVILTFLAAGTVMYNRYDIYMKQGVRDEAAYIKTGAVPASTQQSSQLR